MGTGGSEDQVKREKQMDDFRQAVIDALTDFYDHVGFYDKMSVAKCIGIVKGIPYVEPRRKKGSCAECQQIKDLCTMCKRNVNIKDYFIRGKEE